MKKIAIVVIILICITIISGCTGENNDSIENTVANGEQNAQSETSNPNEPELPDVTFDGYTFRILNTKENSVGWLVKTLVAEEETGEGFNDAIYRRNLFVEEKYNIKIVQIDANDPNDVLTKARRSIQANDNDYDMIMNRADLALTLAQGGFLTKIDTVENINLSKPYWDQDMNRDFSISGNIYFTSGDFSFNQYSATVPMLFNKRLISDLGLENPYELVRSGKWTLDKFSEMGKAAVADLDGDGKINPKTDRVGFMGQAHVYTLAFMIGSDERYTAKDDNDLPYVIMNTERFFNVFDKIYDIVHQPDFLYDLSAKNLGDKQFYQGQVLFWTEVTLNSTGELRNMEDNFGILPHPKFDESQEEYWSSTGLPHVMCIPANSQNLGRTGIILEALCAESMKSVKSEFYDTMLKTKIMGRDDESGEMLDLIFSHRVYEIGRMYWDSSIANTIAALNKNNDKSIVSTIEKNSNAYNKAIQDAINAFVD